MQHLSSRGIAGSLISCAEATRRNHAARESQVAILGLRLDNITMSQAVDSIIAKARGVTPTQIAFVNAHCVNVACVDADYRAVLEQASLTLADGSGVKLGAKILGADIIDNVNGTDMFPLLCATLSGSGLGLFLLGGRPGVAAQVCEWIARNYPGVTVAGFEHGYFSPTQSATVAGKIAASGAAILLVAMGVPSQEKWLHRHLHACGIKVGIGVGGLFDFYSGRIPRAPQWLRALGCEWTYRLYQEPGRMWRRYVLGNFLFLARVLWQRVRSGAQPATRGQ